MNPTAPSIALCFCLALAASPSLTAESPELDELRLIAQQRYLDGDFRSASAFYVELSRRLAAEEERAVALLTAAWLEELGARPDARDALLDRALALSTELPFDASLYSATFETAFERAHDRRAGTFARLATERLGAGITELAAGRHAKAQELLEEALEYEPANLRAQYNLALVHLAASRDSEAASRFHRVIALCCAAAAERAEILAKAHSGLGTVHYRAAEWSRAAQAFAAALELDPADARSWKGLGLARMQAGELTAALQALERAVALAPNDADAARHYATALRRDARPEAAISTASTALMNAGAEDPGLLLEVGLAQVSQGQLAEAERSLAAVVAADQAPAGLRATAALHLALGQFERGRHAAALASAERALQWMPDSAQAWNLVGLARQAGGDLERAERALATARELDPSRGEILNNLAGVYTAQGKFEVAERTYVQALTLEPALIEARDGLRQVRDFRSAVTPAGPTRQAVRSTPQPAPRAIRKLRPKQVGLRFVDLDYERLRLRGALVREVTKKSPAARAGMRKGDLVLRVDGYEIENDKDFFDYLRRNPPSGQMEVELLRDGRSHRFTLLLERS